MGDSYVQSYSGFVGVDFTSDPAYVARNRLAHCVNMWRDYDSENGAAIETFPGFREVVGLDDECGEILKVYHFNPKYDYLIIHTTKGIFQKQLTSNISNHRPIELSDKIDKEMNGGYTWSTGFAQNNRLYILSNIGYFRLENDDYGNKASYIVPTRALHGTWKLKPHPMISETKTASWDLNFMSGGLEWKRICITSHGPDWDGEKDNASDGTSYYSVFYENGDESIVAYNGADRDWTDERYKTIYFIGAPQSVNEECFDWFKSNSISNPTTIEDAYIPTTYFNGKKYEQRNMIFDRAYQIETAGGTEILSDMADPETAEDMYDVQIALLEKAEKGKILVWVDDIQQVWNGKKYLTWDEVTSEDGIPRITFPKKEIYDEERLSWKKIKIEYQDMDPIKFGTIEAGVLQSAATLQYSGTSLDAILNCRKAAIHDGRIFLTGNPALPNTVFFSARNSTGANDPTYFGVYNYFNDGYGNTPNVDMLSTPSMLMVIKRDTVQDGSVYYHTGQDNTDDDSKNLIPRIYPSISGAAGLGSVGTLNSQGVLSCNFLDDTVFLTKRGLDGVSKEAVNLERTIGHRSYCVDKRLLKEDLSKASMAEWKGYLVICCNGHLYLADSRSRTQHSDGSYQYEWFYMEGLAARSKKQEYVYSSYAADEYFENGYSIDKQRAGELVDADKKIWDTNGTRYVEEDGVKYLVEALCYKPSDEKIKDVVAVGDRLFLISDRHIFLVNTDMERDELGRLTSEAYSFDECRYISGCSTKLDDCGRITVRKNTIYGLTVARFKTMRDSKCTVKTSINGVSFTSNLGEITNFRHGFEDTDYKNVSFDGDADNVAILPERSRGWIRKQYYFFSDWYCQPFGLYELSYHYQVAGKIR